MVRSTFRYYDFSESDLLLHVKTGLNMVVMEMLPTIPAFVDIAKVGVFAFANYFWYFYGPRVKVEMVKK